MQGRRVLTAIAIAAFAYAGSALAMQQPLRLYGNLGYFFTYSETDGGARGRNQHITGTLNAASYLWQPWFATLNGGATVSASQSSIESSTKEAQLLSGNVDLSLLPQSRFPLRLSYFTSNNLNPDTSSKKLFGLGVDYETRLFSARQSVIGRGGDRLDLWYNNRLRLSDNTGDFEDNTVGANLKTRFRNHNFYANGSYQEREVGLASSASNNMMLSLMHHYVPSSRFYIKTLGSTSQIENNRDVSNGSFFPHSTTDVNQVSSFFYWRPEYRPYTATGTVRLHQRTQETSAAVDEQITMNGSLAGTYRINRRTQVTAVGNGTLLESEQTNSVSANVALNAAYQSDRIIYRGFNYNWFANGGVGNTARAQYDTVDFTQNLNAGAGHGLDKSWITGNRSTLRASFTQSAREFFETDEYGSIMTLSHTGSLAWQEQLRNGSTYAQLSAVDTRSFFEEEYEAQIINAQMTRSMPISRLSAWSGSASVQSSRRDTGTDTGKTFYEEFLTTATGRLSYQHERLFGIYRLKFKTKLDVTATLNRDGGDRKQADLEGRLAYSIGKLNTSLIGRWLESDSGLGSWSGMFQLNRSF